MRILNQYVVRYSGVLMILLETTGPVDEKGYGKYYTVSKDFEILPLNQDKAASLIYQNAPDPQYDVKKVLAECQRLIADGNPLSALRLYKTTMGCTLTEAKSILNL